METTAMEEEASSPPPLSLVDPKTILAESRRIITANSRHFYILFVPISFSPYLFPILQKLLISPNNSSSEILIISFLIIMYSLFAFTSNLLAIGSVTHSVRRALHGTPLKLAQSMESAIASFFPLLTVALLPQSQAIATLLLSGTMLYQLNGQLQPEHLFLLILLVLLALSVQFAWLLLNWGLAYTAAVVETRCEIGDLVMDEVKRKMGYRKLILYQVLLMTSMFWGFSVSAVDFEQGGGGRRAQRISDYVLSFLHFIFFTCFYTYGVNIVFLFNAVSSAVMYMHCATAEK